MTRPFPQLSGRCNPNVPTMYLVAMTGLLPVLVPATARAQLLDQYIQTNIYGLDDSRGVTVLSRRHPELDPVPLKVGDTEVLPTFQQGFGYDDNVVGQTRARGSSQSRTDAGVTAARTTSDSSIGAGLAVQSLQYFDEPQQSQTTWNAQLGGTRQFGDDLAGAQFTHLNGAQNARSLNAPSLRSPLEYRIEDFKAYYNKDFSRVLVQPGIEVSSLDYDDSTVGGVRFTQSFLNRVVVTPSVTVRYRLAPLRDLVFVVSDSENRYLRSGPIAARDSTAISAMAGIDYGSGGVWRYRVLAGVQRRSFASSLYRETTTPVVEADVIWNPTPLTTVTGVASRNIQDSTQQNIAAYTETDLRLNVDHELRRNVILSGFGAIGLAEFQSGLTTAGAARLGANQSGSTQSLVSAGASATWTLTRMIKLTASYAFAARDRGKNGTILFNGVVLGTNYTENQYLLQGRIAF